MHSGAIAFGGRGRGGDGTAPGMAQRVRSRGREQVVMRQVTRKGLITMVAATGALATGGGYAQADSGAHGTAPGSPGVLSGNTVHAPVDVPVNACGNTVNAVGLLNPAYGNTCVNASARGGPQRPGGAHAGGRTTDSPGVASGNTVEAPVHVPVNACGNSVDVIGVGNPAMGNDCGNGDAGTPPGRPTEPTEPTEPGGPGGPGNPGVPRRPALLGTPALPGTPVVLRAPARPVGPAPLGSRGRPGRRGAPVPPRRRVPPVRPVLRVLPGARRPGTAHEARDGDPRLARRARPSHGRLLGPRRGPRRGIPHRGQPRRDRQPAADRSGRTARRGRGARRRSPVPPGACGCVRGARPGARHPGDSRRTTGRRPCGGHPYALRGLTAPLSRTSHGALTAAGTPQVTAFGDRAVPGSRRSP